MFSNVYLRVIISCLFLSFAPTTSAALDGLVKANNHISDSPPVRLAYANLNENNTPGNHYKTATAVKVMVAHNMIDSGHTVAEVEQKPMPKLLLGFACGLAFLGMMKRRLSR